jgi:hypothetical protein
MLVNIFNKIKNTYNNLIKNKLKNNLINNKELLNKIINKIYIEYENLMNKYFSVINKSITEKYLDKIINEFKKFNIFLSKNIDSINNYLVNKYPDWIYGYIELDKLNKANNNIITIYYELKSRKLEIINLKSYFEYKPKLYNEIYEYIKYIIPCEKSQSIRIIYIMINEDLYLLYNNILKIENKSEELLESITNYINQNIKKLTKFIINDYPYWLRHYTISKINELIDMKNKIKLFKINNLYDNDFIKNKEYDHIYI